MSDDEQPDLLQALADSFAASPFAAASSTDPAPTTERFENCSVEVARWGPNVWLAIRSEQSVGKAIELTLDEASDLAAELTRAASSTQRRIRDEPRA
jgi:hypothetical protein